MRMTTLNISSNAIKYVVAGGSGAVKHGSVSSEGLINNGLILQPDAIAKQLKSIFTSNALPRERVICTINGLPFSYRLVTLPKMEARAFEEAIIRTIRKEMPISPEEMYLSWQAYPTDKNEWQVLVAGVTRQPVDNLIKTLRAAGIPPYYLDLQHLALARLTSEHDAIIVEFEKDYSNIVMLVEGVPQALNIIPSLGPQAARPDEVRQITSKLNKMVDFYNSNHPKKPVRDTVKVLLTGELVNDDKVVELIRQELIYPVELLAPTQKVISGLPIYEYAANAGSLLMDITPKKEGGKDAAPCRHINLAGITREMQTSNITGKSMKNWLVGIAVVGGLAALVFAFLSQSQTQTDIDKIQSQLTEANAKLGQTQGAVSSTQTIQDDINKIVAQIQGIQSKYDAVVGSSDYVSDIAAINRSLPQGVVFTSLDMGPKQISIYGRMERTLMVVQFARNLESTGGFSQATIHWIDKATSDVGPGYSFLIVINR
jgi:Tfp pilus assembly PilM family ATPase/Tfp pilus assembly protein PilN